MKILSQSFADSDVSLLQKLILLFKAVISTKTIWHHKREDDWLTSLSSFAVKIKDVPFFILRTYFIN